MKSILPSSLLSSTVVCLILVFLAFPIIVVAAVSFSSANYLTFPPPALSLKWYRVYFSAENWLNPTWLSIWVAAAVVVLSTLLGTLAALGIATVGVLGEVALADLERSFGRYGRRLYELARGIDDRVVNPHLPTQSISAEDTFEADLLLDEIAPSIVRLAAKTWAAAGLEKERVGRTVMLKLKTAHFQILTRSHTPLQPPSSIDEMTAIALDLRTRVQLPQHTRYRLVGVGLGNFRAVDASLPQPELFD